MDLGPIERAVLAALRRALGDGVECHRGPAAGGAATGLRPQVFVHAALFEDAGGATPDGAQSARWPLAGAGGRPGFCEQRPATIDVEIACVCGRHAQAQSLAGLVAPVAMPALSRLGPVRLDAGGDDTREGGAQGDARGDAHGEPPADAGDACCLHFEDHCCTLHRVRSGRFADAGADAAMAQLTLRLHGFLHVELVLGQRPPAGRGIVALDIQADPAGVDLAREHVRLHNCGAQPLDLAGWSLRDAARRPHVYRFPAPCVLPPGGELRVWSGAGPDTAGDLHWGRRRAVWNDTGDVARLFDADGVERARAVWQPPVPVVPASKPAGAAARGTTPETAPPAKARRGSSATRGPRPARRG